jgi:hypothetical protein
MKATGIKITRFDMIRIVLGVIILSLISALSAAESTLKTAPPIHAVWLLKTQPCNGGGGNSMSRYSDEDAVKKQGAVTLNSLGITYKLPPVENVESLTIKLFLNDKSRGVIDSYILIAAHDLEAPFGAIVITELPALFTNSEAAFQAVETLQKASAGAAFTTIKQRVFEDPRLGKCVEYIIPNRVGSHCFPTADYQFLPENSKLRTVGISRFFLSDLKLIEVAFIANIPLKLSSNEADQYARNEMDRYVEGLTVEPPSKKQSNPANK